jgi:hypothetical protein
MTRGRQCIKQCSNKAISSLANNGLSASPLDPHQSCGSTGRGKCSRLQWISNLVSRSGNGSSTAYNTVKESNFAAESKDMNDAKYALQEAHWDARWSLLHSHGSL